MSINVPEAIAALDRRLTALETRCNSSAASSAGSSATAGDSPSDSSMTQATPETPTTEAKSAATDAVRATYPASTAEPPVGTCWISDMTRSAYCRKEQDGAIRRLFMNGHSIICDHPWQWHNIAITGERRVTEAEARRHCGMAPLPEKSQEPCWVDPCDGGPFVEMSTKSPHPPLPPTVEADIPEPLKQHILQILNRDQHLQDKLNDMERQRDHWKSNHDRMRDKKQEERATVEAVLRAAEEWLKAYRGNCGDIEFAKRSLAMAAAIDAHHAASKEKA